MYVKVVFSLSELFMTFNNVGLFFTHCISLFHKHARTHARTHV